MIDSRLNTFLTLASIKNFTKTGELLNLTQPAVSQHIKFLEKMLEVKLIEKKGRNVSLTQEGEILLNYGNQMQMLSKNLMRELGNKNKIIKKYNVGATMTIGEYLLPYILGEYKGVYKNVDIILNVDNTRNILKKLMLREIDIALVEGPFDKKRFLNRKLKEDELIFVSSPKHPLSQKKKVDMEEILRGNLILRERGSGTRKIFEEKAMQLGYDIRDIHVYMEIGSISAIKSLVESNLGYTVISREAVKRELQAGSMVTVPIKNVSITREFNFVYMNEGDKDFVGNFIHFCLNLEGGY